MCRVARHNENKGVSCGRIQCALEEGPFCLIVHIQANRVLWPLPSLWNVFSLSLPLLKLVSFSSSTLHSFCCSVHQHLQTSAPWTWWQLAMITYPLNTTASSSNLQLTTTEHLFYSRYCAQLLINILWLSFTALTRVGAMVILVLHVRKLKFGEVV